MFKSNSFSTLATIMAVVTIGGTEASVREGIRETGDNLRSTFQSAGSTIRASIPRFGLRTPDSVYAARSFYGLKDPHISVDRFVDGTYAVRVLEDDPDYLKSQSSWNEDKGLIEKYIIGPIKRFYQLPHPASMWFRHRRRQFQLNRARELAESLPKTSSLAEYCSILDDLNRVLKRIDPRCPHVVDPKCALHKAVKKGWTHIKQVLNDLNIKKPDGSNYTPETLGLDPNSIEGRNPCCCGQNGEAGNQRTTIGVVSGGRTTIHAGRVTVGGGSISTESQPADNYAGGSFTSRRVIVGNRRVYAPSIDSGSSATVVRGGSVNIESNGGKVSVQKQVVRPRYMQRTIRVKKSGCPCDPARQIKEHTLIVAPRPIERGPCGGGAQNQEMAANLLFLLRRSFKKIVEPCKPLEPVPCQQRNFVRYQKGTKRASGQRFRAAFYRSRKDPSGYCVKITKRRQVILPNGTEKHVQVTLRGSRNGRLLWGHDQGTGTYSTESANSMGEIVNGMFLNTRDPIKLRYFLRSLVRYRQVNGERRFVDQLIHELGNQRVSLGAVRFERRLERILKAETGFGIKVEDIFREALKRQGMQFAGISA